MAQKWYNEQIMSILDPQSIAVIGASATEGKVGHDILKNLLTQGYGGTVFPVNPKGGEILGATVYASINDIPAVPDLAVIVIPAAAVPAALTECGEKGIKHAVVISAGFGEVHTDEGKKLEEELTAIAENYQISLVGPNCLGIVRPHSKMNASFAKDLPPAGGVGIVSQSGATAVALMDAAPSVGIGLSAMVSIGNKAVMDESDWLEILEKDEQTKVIGFYLESVKDGRRFLHTALSCTKPIVLLKAGVSEHGRKAASSHTGALAGSDAAIDALCAQTGIHRAHTSEEFFDLLAVLSTQPQLPTNRIGIITNAGGPGILATDAAEAVHLHLSTLSDAIAAELKLKLPAAASVNNPIDVIGDAGVDRYEAAIDACQKDPGIDGLVVILTPQVMTPCDAVAELIVRKSQESPLMPVTACFMGGASVDSAKKILRTGGIPCFETPERAVRALRALAISHERLAINSNHVPLPATRFGNLLDKKSGLLDEETTAQLFSAYHLPLPRQALAKTAEEAVHIAEQLGYPVIAKISSPDILHKTDVGGVRANLKNAQDIVAAFNGIMTDVRKHRPDAPVNGVLIQQFLPVGNEFIVGAVRDSSFGPLVMAGLGGIYTELFKDSVFRIAPVNEADAYTMLSELTSWKLLLGMRGKPRADIDALATVIVNVSRMVSENPSIAELDLNPVLVGSDGIVIADAKVVVRMP
jgi:acetate---CoA ligase (ADP-forming)